MASSRYALGERKIVIHTPRVGQRSYGTEKRYVYFRSQSEFWTADAYIFSDFCVRLLPPPS